jgi:hypothetical protein
MSNYQIIDAAILKLYAYEDCADYCAELVQVNRKHDRDGEPAVTDQDVANCIGTMLSVWGIAWNGAEFNFD